MRFQLALSLLVCLCLAETDSFSQSADTITGQINHFPDKFLQKVQTQSTDMNKDLTKKTEQYLSRMAGWESQLKTRLAATDPQGATSLFGGSQQQYAALAAGLRSDTAHRQVHLSGQYFPYADTLQGMMGFLKQYPQLLASKAGMSSEVESRLQAASAGFQDLQARLQDAEIVKAYIQSRQAQITTYLARYPNLSAILSKPLSRMQQEQYYYAQRLVQYKAMLSDPDALAKKALSMVTQLPAFQTFMKTHSQLGTLFHLSRHDSAYMHNLQTKEQVANAVKSQVSASGSAGTAALQGSLQSAHSQLAGYKEKLSKFGIGNGDWSDTSMIGDAVNDQKTKTFLKRLQFGYDFQTSHTNAYYPSILSLGFNLGYKLGHSNVIGIGAAYELGTGNGINDVHFTSQGLGLRSFVNIKIKGSLSASGGFEYNYTTPFTAYQQLKQIQYWQRSGLLGVTKAISTKSKVLKQTTLSLLWDFLSYQNVPPTQPVIFRIGYNL